MESYIHRTTKEILALPTEEMLIYDEEPWQDVIQKIEAGEDVYLHVCKMSSHKEYELMEEFAHSLKDAAFGAQILQRLSWKGPFRQFKALIEDSIHRQAWFDFKTHANIEYVREQIDEESFFDD